MSEKSGKAIYIEKWFGWFWVVPVGQRSWYFGPYKTEDKAKQRGPQEYAEFAA